MHLSSGWSWFNTAARIVPVKMRFRSECPVHDALRAGVAAFVAAAVLESGLAVCGLAAGVQFVDGEYNAGLAAAEVRRQFGGLPHCGLRGEGAEALALLPPVDQEAPQQPDGVVVGPASQGRGTCLERQHADGGAVLVHGERVPGLFLERDQHHSQRLADELLLPLTE